MKIIFMGTPLFAVPSLQSLIQHGYDVVAVITATDKYGGRGGKELLVSPIKKIAQEHNIPVLQPKNLKHPDFIDELKSYQADLQIVVAFRMLPEVVWDMPPLGTYNLHGSLLPKYRGAAPINWAIINGDEKTGVTFFKLKHAIDTGDMLLQREMVIKENDTAGDVHDRMMELGAEVIMEGVEMIINEEVALYPQDINEVSKAPKIFKDDCVINFNTSGEKIVNFIRGLAPYPGAFFDLAGKQCKVYKATYLPYVHHFSIGQVYTDNKTFIHVTCLDGMISIEDIKLAGKSRMKIDVFLNGFTMRWPE